MMTLNEKLELISDLEKSRFKQDVIHTIVESLEHPEKNNGPFETLEELWDHIDSLPDEENIDEKNRDYMRF